MKKGTIITIALIASLSAWGVGIYGSFIKKENAIKEQLTELNNLYQKHDLAIPDLINTTKIYAIDETFDQIDALYSAIKTEEFNVKQFSAEQISQYLQTRDEFNCALDAIIALQQTHPQLMENQIFISSQQYLQDAKEQIWEHEKSLDCAIAKYNESLGKIPNKLIAKWFDFEPINVEYNICDDYNAQE